jgi:hypothetical protein
MRRNQTKMDLLCFVTLTIYLRTSFIIAHSQLFSWCGSISSLAFAFSFSFSFAPQHTTVVGYILLLHILLYHPSSFIIIMCQVDPDKNAKNVVTPPSSSQTIAIIGGGVSGLAAAWHLLTNTTHSVQVFESQAKLGGHAYTTPVAVEPKKEDNNENENENEIEIHTIDVDVGFMVFNDPNYPNMVRWFEELQIPIEHSDMSLSVSLDKGRTLEWNSDGMNGVFARRSQLLEPTFYQMILDMKRFHNEAPLVLQLSLDDPRRQVTTGQYLKRHNYSEAFGMYYLLPMMAALWSASMENVMDFPAVQLISFLANHQMLNFTNRPQVCPKICVIWDFLWVLLCECLS